jgi:hypothetical membrane protein
MTYSSGKVAGALMFIAVTQFVLGLIISEALYPNYSTSRNYISALGVGPSSMIFNSSVFLLGFLLMIGACFLQRTFDFKLLTALLVLTGIGAMGVGIFTGHFGIIHGIVSFVAFLFGGLSTIFSVICSYVHKFKLLEMPFSAIALILGLTSVGALVLFMAHVDLGLGVGGMERMIVYPLLMWYAGFGGLLMMHPERRTTERKP